MSHMHIASRALIDGRYRYWLTRVWDSKKPMLGWVMLNPSTADGNVDDPTIRRCIAFAMAHGYGGIVVCNLMAFRATDPSNLPMDHEFAMGPFNLYHIGAELRGLDVVCAWGANPKAVGWHQIDTMKRLADSAKNIYCLGRTLRGYPKHPLYVPASQPFEAYP